MRHGAQGEMRNMADKSVAKLFAVQELDKEIWALKRERKEIPERKARMEAVLETQKAAVADAEAGLKSAQAAQKAAEGEADALREQIARFKTQQMSVKTNDEYRAIVKQIATAEEQVRGLEDRILEKMEGVEAARAELSKAKEALAAESAKVKAEVEAFLGRAEGLEVRTKELEAERAAKAAEVDADWLGRYERLFEKHPDGAVVVAEHGTCGGCHMKLSPSQMVEAHRDDTLTACAFCGRYLYRLD